MKIQKILLFVAFMYGTTLIYANVGIFSGTGANVELQSTDKIQMVSETVDITLTRAGFRVNGGANWLALDKALYTCRFTLKNLTDKTVTVPVGFPLNGEYGLIFQSSKVNAKQINQTEIISLFNFIAGTSSGSYPVRFARKDKTEKYRKLFLWNMTFKPNETTELLVSYSLSGYHGLGTLTKRAFWRNRKYKHDYFSNLELSYAEIFGYVTSTAKSWAGPVEQATFNVQLNQFDEYLKSRPAIMRDKDEKLSQRQLQRLEEMMFNTLYRKIMPDGWKVEKSKSGSYISWQYKDFKPEQDISIGYYYTRFPQTVPQAEKILGIIKRDYDRGRQSRLNSKRKNFPAPPEWNIQDDKNVADIILEFYGVKSDNPDISDFLKRQIWYPVTDPPKLDPELKAYLMKLHKVQ